jgi:hypothetical protein
VLGQHQRANPTTGRSSATIAVRSSNGSAGAAHIASIRSMHRLRARSVAMGEL